jgi:tetratricopeptide (TPR) repeat protein
VIRILVCLQKKITSQYDVVSRDILNLLGTSGFWTMDDNLDVIEAALAESRLPLIIHISCLSFRALTEYNKPSPDLEAVIRDAKGALEQGQHLDPQIRIELHKALLQIGIYQDPASDTILEHVDAILALDASEVDRTECFYTKVCFHIQGRFKDMDIADEYLDKLDQVSTDGNNLARILRAYQALTRGQLDEINSHLDGLTDDMCSRQSAFYLLKGLRGIMATLTGEYDEAQELLEHALIINQPYIFRRFRQHIRICLGYVVHLKKDRPAAHAYYQDYIDHESLSPDFWFLYVITHAYNLRARNRSSRMAKFLEKYRDRIDQLDATAQPKIHLLMGQIYIETELSSKSGRQKAIQSLKTVLTYDNIPNFVEWTVYFNLGKIYSLTPPNYDQARECLLRVINVEEFPQSRRIIAQEILARLDVDLAQRQNEQTPSKRSRRR